MNAFHVPSSFRRRGLLGRGGAVALAPVLALVAASCSGDTTDPEALGSAAQPERPHVAVCPEEGPGYARCHARVVVDAQGDVQPFATPNGFGPADLQSAYNLPATPAACPTVAIVDAYDNPNAESDLGVYRSQYGLPPCTTSNGCFMKVNQQGQASPLPAQSSGWGLEIALDVDMVSAACPCCKILLVEATTNSFANLAAAVGTAASLGAVAISNSYGGGEFSGETYYDQNFYNQPGALITASSGDSGYGAQFPATGSHVIAVGGTRLVRSTNARGWAESAWSGTGSGCSAFIAKPSFQVGFGGCSRRIEADVSAVADPSTGVAVYDTFGEPGWIVVGGTSAASPLVAAILAATGIAGAAGVDNSWPYANTGAFYDVTTGSNGNGKGCHGTAYLCKAGTGYDGPTGWGTPNAASF